MNATRERIFTRKAYVFRVVSLGNVDWRIKALNRDAGKSAKIVSAFSKALGFSIPLTDFPFNFYCFLFRHASPRSYLASFLIAETIAGSLANQRIDSQGEGRKTNTSPQLPSHLPYRGGRERQCRPLWQHRRGYDLTCQDAVSS